MQYDNPYDIGMTGLLGYGAAAEGIEDADLLILLGTDFPYDQFLPGTRTAQVDRAAHEPGPADRRRHRRARRRAARPSLPSCRC